MTLKERIDQLQALKARAIEEGDREAYRRVIAELRALEPKRGK